MRTVRERKNKMKTLLSLLVGIALLPVLNCSADVKIEEQVVGPASEPGTIYWLSPKGLHLATAHPKGSRFVVTVDGVDGEKYDEILQAAAKVETRYDGRGNPIIQNVMWKAPVAFSPDGSHYAYAARIGKEVVVILDGKEIYRTPHSLAVEVVALLSFTPDSKHLYFYAHSGETMGSYRLMMDGQAMTPSFVGTPAPFFSTDGAHWGLFASKPMKPDETFLIVDGKVPGYTGQRLQFTPDGKHVVCTKSGDGKEAVLVDGKPMMVASSIDKIAISPTGDIGVIAYGSEGKKRLYINGKPALGGEDAMSVTFSPDGKHWAASCISSPAFWVVVDGKKQQEYSSVHDIAFTPDSSKCVYIAESGAKKFVVINGEEDEGGTHISIAPMFGKTGGHVAYCNVLAWQVMNIHHDDKIVPKNRQVSELTLSPNGARHAYYNALDALSGQLIVDGEVKGGGTAYKDLILFSPDSQHFVAMSSAPSNGRRAICLDGKFVPIPKGLDQYTKPLGFTPDSQHLLMRGQELAKTGDYYMDKYFLDGQYVAQFFAGGIQSGLLQGNSQLPMQSEFWETQPDGSVIIIGHENFQDNKRGGVVKRVIIKPDAGTSIATWIANANASEERPVVKAAAPRASIAPSGVSASLAQSRSVPDNTAVLDAAPAKPLTWADLVNHPERWPTETKLTTQLRFGTDTLKAGTPLKIDQVDANGARLIAPQGFAFTAEPKMCDLLQAANALWGTLSPEQKTLTRQAIQQDVSLWPGKVKILDTLNVGNLRIDPGTVLPVVEVKADEVTVMHPRSTGSIVISTQNTDLFSRARELVSVPVDKRPGRMADVLEGATVGVDGSPVALQSARYYVIYFAGSTCPRCKVFTPKLVDHFNKTLANRKDVAFVTMPASDDSTRLMLNYVRQNMIPWPTIPLEKRDVLNKESITISKDGVINLPGILVVDRFGRPLLATNKIGGQPLDAANSALAQLSTVIK